MKTVLGGMFAGGVLCGLSLAQGSAPAPTNGTAPQGQQNPGTAQPAEASSGQASGAARIAPGSVIPV
jgi:hypothetical protein